jgi:hypothetical protein
MRLFTTAIIGLQLLLGSCCCQRWDDVDRFVAGLKCGMTREEITEYVKQYQGTTVYQPGPTNLPDLVVKHGDTKVNCWLPDGRLQAVQVMWISQPMRYTTEERRELCPSRGAQH